MSESEYVSEIMKRHEEREKLFRKPEQMKLRMEDYMKIFAEAFPELDDEKKKRTINRLMQTHDVIRIPQNRNTLDRWLKEVDKK